MCTLTIEQEAQRFKTLVGEPGMWERAPRCKAGPRRRRTRSCAGCQRSCRDSSARLQTHHQVALLLQDVARALLTVWVVIVDAYGPHGHARKPLELNATWNMQAATKKA